jgi:hypothetical protein
MFFRFICIAIYIVEGPMLHMMTQSLMAKYLQNRAVRGPWRIEGNDGHDFAGVVVIPALAEEENLFAALASLAANPPGSIARFLVLVVVNHREDAHPDDKRDNTRTLQRLAAGPPECAGLRLAWVDAASPGRELPVKGGGVGLARKIGLDLALHRIDHAAGRPLLVCLDADTLVETSYLPALTGHFRETSAGGAAVPFRHRQGRSPEEQRAIVCYELFLRHYVLGLRTAGSPYAFHTVGSAMASTAEAYIRSGGMSTRTAGEDFYFLQHLSRTDGVAQVQGTTVHPSPRPSNRVPFGTGRSISRRLAGDDGAITFYRPECFRILGAWLNLVGNSLGCDSSEVLLEATGISPHLADYLEQIRFAESWAGLRRNHRTPERLLRAFHGWFDGLRTMRLVHHLSEREFPRCGPEASVTELLRMAGAKPVEDPNGQLELLRQMDDGEWPPAGPGNPPGLEQEAVGKQKILSP